MKKPRTVSLPNLWFGLTATLLLISTAVRGGETGTIDYAQLDLDQLMAIPVTTASKHQQKDSEAPSSVTVITADAINRYGYRNLGDILRSVRGFYVTDDGNYGYVGIRGFNRTSDFGGRLLLLVDGHRMNDPVYGTFANQQDFVLDVDLIERVEIVRGPGSSLYGDNAFFGVVNVVTRRGGDVGGMEVAVSAGSFATHTGRFTYGKLSPDGVEVLLSGSGFNSRGDDDIYFPEFDDPATGYGHARSIDDEQAGKLFGRVSYHGLSLNGGYVNREKQVPTGRYETVFGDPNFKTWDKRTYAVAEFDRSLGSAWQLLVRGSYDNYLYRAHYPYYRDEIPGPLNLQVDESHSQWVTGEVQLRKSLAEHHLVTLGTEYRYAFSLESLYYNENPYKLINRSDQSVRNWGAFIQDEIKLTDWLLVNVGARLDSYQTLDEQVNPRLGLILSPWPTTTMKLLYGTAYRAPNTNEAYYQKEEDIKDVNPALKVEEITTYEAIWEQQYGSLVRTFVSAYHNEVSGIIEFSPEADSITAYYYVNAGDATVNGFELEVELGRQKDLRGRVSYAYAEVDHQDAAEPFDNSPKHLGKFNLIVPLGSERYTAGLDAQYVSSRIVYGGGHVPSYWIANATLFAQPLGDNLDLSLGVYNLFDEHFNDPAFGVPTEVEQDGRSFRLKVTYRF
jgi:iron complex outermembrane receptor protein